MRAIGFQIHCLEARKDAQSSAKVKVDRFVYGYRLFGTKFCPSPFHQFLMHTVGARYRNFLFFANKLSLTLTFISLILP